MKNSGKISLVIGVFLVLCLISAGCTSSYNSQKVYTPSPTAVQDAGSATAAAVTQVPAAKSEIDNIKEGLDAIASNWLVSDVRCSGSTCTAEMSNENGNTAEIMVFVCSSTDSAKNRFDDTKSEYKGFNMEKPYIPKADDAFIWSEKNDSTGGVLSGNIVAIIDVSIPGGVTISGRESGIYDAEYVLKQVTAII